MLVCAGLEIAHNLSFHAFVANTSTVVSHHTGKMHSKLHMASFQ